MASRNFRELGDRTLDYAQMGQKIRQAREEAGLSQEEMGNRLDCSGVTISTWEMGKRRISLEDLQRVAKEFRKPLAFFFPDGSLSVNIEDQIGSLLRRSIGDLIGTKQIPIYTVGPDNGDPLLPPIHLTQHMRIASYLPVDFGLIIPDDHLAAIGIKAGDVIMCRSHDGRPLEEESLMIQVEGTLMEFRHCEAGEGAVFPVNGGFTPDAQVPDRLRSICGILVLNVRYAKDILDAVKSLQRPRALEA